MSFDVKVEAMIFCSHVTLMTTPRMWVPGGLERRLLDPLSCAHLSELTKFLHSCSQNKFRARVTARVTNLSDVREIDRLHYREMRKNTCFFNHIALVILHCIWISQEPLSIWRIQQKSTCDLWTMYMGCEV